MLCSCNNARFTSSSGVAVSYTYQIAQEVHLTLASKTVVMLLSAGHHQHGPTPSHAPCKAGVQAVVPACNLPDAQQEGAATRDGHATRPSAVDAAAWHGGQNATPAGELAGDAALVERLVGTCRAYRG
jgi:hypothetical protein